MLVIGIDPGIGGAIAAVSDEGHIAWLHDMPIRDSGKRNRKASEIDGARLAHLLAPYVMQVRVTLVEEVHAMPGQGVSSMLSLGDSRGCIRGVLEALGMSVVRIEPRAWKASYGLLRAEKEASRALAIRLYPRCTELGLKRHHGRAEALLLARYGAEHH